MNDSVILNWSNVNKSILVLCLGSFNIGMWIIWWVVSYRIPSLRDWINLDYYPILMRNYSLSSIGCLFFGLLIHIYRDRDLVKKYVSYFTIAYFATTSIYGAYAIGISSPASIAGYVSLVTLGLVLFTRKEVYITTIPISVFILVAAYLSFTHQIAYSPIYSPKLQAQILYQNEFWVYSMMFFYIPIFFVSIVLFITLLIQWRNREEQINYLSKIDPLTQVYNRRHIAQLLSRYFKLKKSYTIVLLDLDFFKQINDRYGHDVGDDVLQQVSKALKLNIRQQDYVGRFGGEEFILVLIDVTKSQASDIAERCRKAIENLSIKISSGEDIRVSASFGISKQSNEEDKDIYIRQADEALYEAKANGRNQVKLFSHTTNSKVLEFK